MNSIHTDVFFQRGIARQYQLGQWLREKYNNFIPKFYKSADTYIYSSDMDRTLMSASANLAGLYPPGPTQIWNKFLPWQPIPVHSNNVDEIFAERDDCYKYNQEFKEVIKLKHFTELNEKYKTLYANLSKKTGWEIDDLKGVREVRDVIYVYEHYNKSYVPSWASEFDRKILDEITGRFFQRTSYTDNLKRYLTGPFFHTLTTHFDKAFSETPYRKIFMISSHESSIVPILDAIGAYDFDPPDFAATVIFELRKLWTNYNVHIYYKQLDFVRALNISGCGTVCNYTAFKNIVSKYSMDFKTWQKSCGKEGE